MGCDTPQLCIPGCLEGWKLELKAKCVVRVLSMEAKTASPRGVGHVDESLLAWLVYMYFNLPRWLAKPTSATHCFPRS